MLRNIIDNAIKYSPDDSKLRIATYAMKREIYVSIQDSGRAFPNRIFRTCSTGSTKWKRRIRLPNRAARIGSSIVKRIIDQHNQTITLKSAKGKGSTFTFTLKRAPAPKRALTDGGRKMEYNGSYQSDKRHTENGRGENAFAAIVIIIVLICWHC